MVNSSETEKRRTNTKERAGKDNSEADNNIDFWLFWDIITKRDRFKDGGDIDRKF